ncbi:hypothetical protein SHKM778_01060 [Streptomyces sp. KM77-8]|uniref:Uncharacterized protein n=1 Tax=Streptomyces haneummycinicus TaxID=3074435 RepID=A0AAT9H8T8_9ACTN
METRADLGLGERDLFCGQAEQPCGDGVDRDLPGRGVPVPDTGVEGGEDVPQGGQGLTSAHCSTL